MRREIDQIKPTRLLLLSVLVLNPLLSHHPPPSIACSPSVPPSQVAPDFKAYDGGVYDNPSCSTLPEKVITCCVRYGTCCGAVRYMIQISVFPKRSQTLFPNTQKKKEMSRSTKQTHVLAAHA